MTTAEKARLERIVAIMSLGLVRSIEEGVVTIDEAEGLLFSPHSMILLRKLKADASLIKMIHGGTELENIASLLPDKLPQCIAEIGEKAIAFLQHSEELDPQLDKWLDKLVASPAVEDP